MGWSDRKICLYTLRIERDGRVFKNNDDRDPFVDNFDAAGGDLLVFISAFVAGLPADELVERDTRHFGQPREVVRRGRTICWEMDGGESGRSTAIKLKKKGKTRKREMSGVEWEPFFVYVVIPKNANVGWLLVEKDGRNSLPVEWREEMRRQFKATHAGYRLIVGTVREASLWSQVENAANEGRLLSFESATRSAKATTGTAGYQVEEVQSRTFLASGEPLPGRALRQWRRERTVTLEGTTEVTLPDDVDDMSDDRYRVKLRDNIAYLKAVVFNHDGKPKTVTFEGLDPVQTIDIEDTATARPTQTRFMTDCRSAVKDLAVSSGIHLGSGWDAGNWKHPKNAPRLEVTNDDSSDASEEAS
ncbi:MAG: hypothetical protein QM809_02925 [Gordonia sp. (in: high G+C Gram-positive bacteria)]|uniref:hypothetical protein n=1 Tax=Gordonia sp. (in: high G+C Gram-positive bacteria) TaxID=84139 RepID=UPI0039E4D368